MSKQYIRTRVLLESAQYQALRDVAIKNKISYSALMRSIVVDFLQLNTSVSSQLQRLKWLEKTQALRKAIMAAHGELEIASVTEVINTDRDERDVQIIGCLS